MSEQVQAAADAAQADYFRFQLQQERSEVAAILANDAKSLRRCMTEGDMGPVGDIRRHIRTVERQLQLIDRMVDALDDRFPDVAAGTPDSGPVRRRA
ncbi:MAG TPA: hypothetical protein VEQ67_02755 [Mycobacterium sp.]|jgi:hypothetical protein|nr:hypothetical protein [Mycobacterium sp.]